MNPELDITQGKARTISKKVCKDFDISNCNVWFIIINDHKALGWYGEKTSNMDAYMMIEKKWSRKLILVLHELTHHIQTEIYEDQNNKGSPHGYTFSLAKNRIATWTRNNISNNYDWESMLTSEILGRRI